MLRSVAVVIILAVAVTALFALLNWYVGPTGPSQRRDLVVALAQIVGGAVLLTGLYFSWRTLQVNREGQITDRFTRAIEQLGSDQLAVRLGGIYALERIAWDSERDQWTVMEVLTAYVRTKAPWSEGDDKAQQDAKAAPQLAPDIQAIATVIARRLTFGHEEIAGLDLRETNLAGADLHGAYLRYARLSGTNLTRARLVSTDLRNARLEGADLTDADLHHADLRDALIKDADFEGAVGIDPALSTAIGVPRTLPGPRPREGPLFPQ